MKAAMFAVQHRTCGHTAGVFNTRDDAERLHGILEAGGYHQFRVRRVTDPVELERAITGLLESSPPAGGCPTCRVDQDRVLALIEAPRG